MNVLLDHLDLFRDGFIGTVSLTAASALLALVLGVLIAGFRVSPVPPLRAFGTVWVTLLRNTPLTLLFLVAFFVVPQIVFPGISSYVLGVLRWASTPRRSSARRCAPASTPCRSGRPRPLAAWA